MRNNSERDLKNVMVMVLLDGKVTDEEKDFIEMLRIRLGVEADEFNNLVREVRAEPKRLNIPRDQRGEETLRLLIETAETDGEISGRELGAIRKIGQFIGLDPSRLERMLPGAKLSPAEQDEITAAVEELYTDFASWDDATRRAKLQAIGSHRRASSKFLLGVLESYRAPDGMDNALEMKSLTAEQIGKLGDERAIYYLAQQISLGDSDDEITTAAFRAACATAIGQIVGETFSHDEEGVCAARQWWGDIGQQKYNRLAF